MRASRYDVAVVGGGPAGLAAAITLLRDGLTVLLIERSGYESFRVGEHLSPNAKPVLAALGIDGLLQDGTHACSPGICSVWGAPEPHDKEYIFNPFGQGWNLSRPAFDRSMCGYVAMLGAEILTHAKVVDLRRTGGRWALGLSQDRAILERCADVVIDATGRAAAIAKKLGAKPIVFDDLTGLAQRACAASPGDHRLFIEAVESGWWYSAGLLDGSIVATFLTDSDLVETSQSGRPSAWCRQLEATALTASRIAALDAAHGIQIRTARTQRLDVAYGEAWLAVGDAAMSFDPLSSAGISKGLDWGRKAARAAAALCRGDRSVARDYGDELERTFSAYLGTRKRYYGMERRWPHAPFWERRHAASAAIVA